MRKKLIYFLLSALVLTGAIGWRAKNFASADSAAAEIAMELTTETVLYESNADRALPMASTTKIMTAIIVIEDCDLDEEIVVDDRAVGVEGSSIYLKKDEKINVRDLLYGLMMRSGNDSAAALAIHHSGSIKEFAKVMNERAREYGAENTNFKNPSGLPDDEHYTTARDLCKIACHAMKNPTFKEIVGTKNYSGKYRAFVSKNKMLEKYEGANGVKTGYTLKAGRCLVSSAERNGMDVVTVVLNCPDMYGESCSILDNCFSSYKLLKLDENAVFMSGVVLCKIKKTKNIVVKCGKNLDFRVVSKNKSKKIKIGDLVAELQIYSENNLLFSENLYSIIDT